MKRVLALILMLALSACNLPSALGPTPTTGVCAYVEARQAQPELSKQFLENLKAATLPVESARAEAYGENCLASDNSVVRFLARETDFYVILNVANLTDETVLGGQLAKILDIIAGMPSTETGPNPGIIGVTFKAGNEIQNLRFSRTEADNLRTQGLKGSDLYRALKTTP